jgi:hypothetical protein
MPLFGPSTIAKKVFLDPTELMISEKPELRIGGVLGSLTLTQPLKPYFAADR